MISPNIDLKSWIAPILVAAREASDAILAIYQSDFVVEKKEDKSPVTAADAAAEIIILRHLEQLAPQIPVIAEEQASADGLPVAAPETFWLVDPLDGTKEFIKRNGEFTVNIALISGGVPVLGVVGLPAKGTYYTGYGSGTAQRIDEAGNIQRISVRPRPSSGGTAAYSRSHADADALETIFTTNQITERIIAGSSLKFCLIAEGNADLYPRLGPTMEWDTAAGHAVLIAAGGRVDHLDGRAFEYGKTGFRNPGFIAYGG